ncbi:hypothetical protein VMT65_31190 [Nocardia sp. CDC153]|uniref:hypothetical protein n=1 Tax=Nocardia sp. CDC153 TaxID=3112167 RepID=UPI002DB5F139|nr:hypothetical protein [Nocardia sp. CDC153]MEC3957535.1 hypothetical protein [Nocardia sp. CDC153]
MVYLLHFDRPYRHAAHYTGTTTDLDARLADHAAGRGARLMEVVIGAGIGFRRARTWAGGRARERQLKREGGASRHCPECGVAPHGSQFVGTSRAEIAACRRIELEIARAAFRRELPTRPELDWGMDR